MKIVIDLTSLADNFTGIERYALNIARALIRQDQKQEHTYILLFKKEIHARLQEFLPWKNVEYRVLPTAGKFLFAQGILPFYLYGIRADAYLFLAFQSPVLFRKRGIFNTIHDLTCWDCPETMKKKMEWYFRISIRNALQVSKGILTISIFTQKRILEKFHYDPERLILAYCGISDVFQEYVRDREEGRGNRELEEQHRQKQERIRQTYQLPERYLLCLATLEPRKNLPFLVSVYEELLEEGKIDLPLVLAGRKGWKMEAFLDSIRQSYRDRIRITGFIEDEDLPYVYDMAECFLFPSVYEGFGMPPLEAAAVGTPVLSSDAASLPEVLGRQAEYFRSGDRQELKEGILRAAGGELCRQESKDPGEWERQKEMFCWESAAKQVALGLGISRQPS